MSTDIGRATVFTISMKTNGRCFYCNRPAQVVDHFISRAKWEQWNLNEIFGSCSKTENLFPACWRCNTLKKDKAPEDFIGNPYHAWRRYDRANARIGILTQSV